MTGSGKSILSNTIGLSASDNVSPVVISFKPIQAAISPALTSLISSLLFECICTILPTLSFFDFVELITASPTDKTPEYTLMNVRVPTNGSVAILNASAENGSSSDDFLESSTSSSCELFGITPVIALTSSGAGKKSITASSIAWTPLFLNAEPHKPTINSFANDLILKPSFI